MNKKELRQKFSLIIKLLPKARRQQASTEACKHLTLLASSATSVASFAPFGNEVDIWPFNKEMIKQKKLFLPRVSGKDLNFYKVTEFSELVSSQWNILEPGTVNCSPAKVDEIDFFLIPGLAYDTLNQRLGRGKGFYDRFISLHSPQKTFGIGFLEQQFTKNLPVELHDQMLEKVFLF